MKEIVVISGKGGTGKTSIAASFGMLAIDKVVLADCDVDAANMHLLTGADFAEKHEFMSGEVAYIHQDTCTECGLCEQKCRFSAITHSKSGYTVNPLKCEGCGLCARLCPVQCIQNIKSKSGDRYFSNIRNGGLMVHARLAIGASNSGKLVANVKEEAQQQAVKSGRSIILIDGSPGIGCPVISSLSGAALAVIVTEAILSGFHDMKRISQLAENFKIPMACIINKADLNEDVHKEIRLFLKEKKIRYLASIPYDSVFIEAITKGKTVVEIDSGQVGDLIRESWNKIMQIL